MRIDVRGVDVVRGRSLAIRGVTLEARPGEWLGIVGANGSGKTSLLRAVAGRIEVASGGIAINGVDVTSDRASRARVIGFASEAALLPGGLVPGQLLSLLAGRQHHLDQDRDLAPLRAALGIAALLDRRMSTLSSGNRQRIAIYAAFVASAPRQAVILDEPFNWLDPVCAYDLKTALSGLVAKGLTLITALHDLASWAMLCDHGILLTDGAVAADLSAAELIEGRRDIVCFERDIIGKLSRPNAAPLP
ncbi:ATP-binding cassette domain-containing protein [Sphingomonas bacterium]|uniref:ATP-binding cassette domain-containing protein n=1 Tax=Sphingomonas bacterium TaxID=1895847 RepID=UPI0015766452|nr:ABC transporter ATP-binding protein [Sphingomonas bacterium]